MKAGRLLFLCLLPLAGGASDYFAEDGGIQYAASTPEECFNFDNRHMRPCIRHLHDASKAELEQTLSKLRGRIERDLALLDEAQSEWAAFKKAECKVRSVSAQAYANPEQQKQLFIDACEIELNRARVDQLKEIVLGCDSCLQ